MKMIKRIVGSWCFVLLSLTGLVFAEDWKGSPSEKEFSFGLQGGLGIWDGAPGVGVAGSVGKKILNQGFVPEINNQVFVETQFGPLYVKSHFTFMYGIHLRWDFQKDERWALFALGGLGGNITTAALGSRWDFYPRFGIGAFLNIDQRFRIRFEVSHEFTSVGAVFLL